ncbi:MAG: tRNA (adenosine(37)-N6)-threonylcarbamoyltransferase complex dimerization subunit type 1 TsaB [Bacteroidota bacterium]
MALILNIETATQVCSVALSDGKDCISIRESHEKNIHAAKVTVFCEEVLRDAGKEMKDLDAVAVSMGPGSYTGLRIGVSAAKGFGYALAIPLIAVPTLQSLAMRALSATTRMEGLYCPMIDARRMEVYTALFDIHNNMVRDTEALIIDERSYDEELRGNTIFFFGDGAEKCREVLEPKGMKYLEGMHPSASDMAVIADNKFVARDFADLAYFEPYYLKDFIAGIPKVKGLR